MNGHNNWHSLDIACLQFNFALESFIQWDKSVKTKMWPLNQKLAIINYLQMIPPLLGHCWRCQIAASVDKGLCQLDCDVTSYSRLTLLVSASDGFNLIYGCFYTLIHSIPIIETNKNLAENI